MWWLSAKLQYSLLNYLVQNWANTAAYGWFNFGMYFFERKYLYFNTNFIEAYSLGSSQVCCHGSQCWHYYFGTSLSLSNNWHWFEDEVPIEFTVYPKKHAHGFVVLCFVVVMQSFIMNSHEVFIHIHQGCFAGTGAIVRLPQCQWSKPDGYGKISQCITTTKHTQQSKNRVHIS